MARSLSRRHQCWSLNLPAFTVLRFPTGTRALVELRNKMVIRRLCGKLFTSTVTEEKLKGFDVTTIADLRCLDLSVLETRFGRYGSSVYAGPDRVRLAHRVARWREFSLRWSDVDMEKNVLNILAQKTGKDAHDSAQFQRSKSARGLEFEQKNDLVLYNHGTGEKFVDLKTGFSLACKKVGISDVSWHTLRHTFASRLLDRGVDIVTVQQLLGHFDSHRNHALYAHKSRVEESRGSKIGERS